MSDNTKKLSMVSLSQKLIQQNCHIVALETIHMLKVIFVMMVILP